ncbi:choice-of-anchor D domain-containing protein, partial [Flavobacterium sp. LBUM151]
MKKKILLIIIITILQTLNSFAQTQVYELGLSDISSQGSCGNVKYGSAGNILEFRWTSTGTGVPVSISVSLNYAVNCNAVAFNNKVTFNGSNQGTQPTPGPYSCTCAPSSPAPTTWNLNPSNYIAGGLNVLRVDAMSTSEGINLLPGYPGAYARVTVRYANSSGPEINIKNGTESIVKGDVTPATGDGTEYGSLAAGTSLDRTFTIENEGTSDLTLPDSPIVTVSGSSAFSIQTQPASNTIAASASQTFVVRFNPTCVQSGLQTAVVSIASNDANETPYTFTVQGTGAADNVKPIAIAKNITVQLDATGNATVNAEDLNDNSTDNCGISSYKIASGSSGTVCNMVNEGSVLSLTAPSGVFTNVLFASYGTPAGSCGSFTMGGCNASNSVSAVSSYLLGQSSANISADNGVFGDPCGGTPKRLAVEAAYGPSISSATASITYSCADIGTHDVVLYVTDNNGNISSVNATITIEDKTLPTIVCATPASSYNNDLGVCNYTVSDTSLDPTATDNCSVTVSNDFNSTATLNGATFPLGTTTVIWTATDASGNTATCTYDIVVV